MNSGRRQFWGERNEEYGGSLCLAAHWKRFSPFSGGSSWPVFEGNPGAEYFPCNLKAPNLVLAMQNAKLGICL